MLKKPMWACYFRYTGQVHVTLFLGMMAHIPVVPIKLSCQGNLLRINIRSFWCLWWMLVGIEYAAWPMCEWLYIMYKVEALSKRWHCLFVLLSWIIANFILYRLINELNEDRAEISFSTQITLPLYYGPFQALHPVVGQMNVPKLFNIISAMSANLLFIKYLLLLS